MPTGIIYPNTAGGAPAGQVYADGSVYFGSAQLTFNGTAVYDTDDFTCQYPVNRKEQTSRFGVPARAFGLPKWPTATGAVQIPANSSYMPKPGDTVTADVFSAATWLVDNMGIPYKKEDYLVVNANLVMKIN